MKVKIFGAGSIGNHLANASRRLGWDVAICDLDPEALNRTKNEIYPGRYGEWDENISLYHNNQVPHGGFDLIIIGTPPDTHLEIALAALKENPQAILIEKPVCGPNLKNADKLISLAKKQGVSLFVGYDHVVSTATSLACDLATQNIGNIITLDVEFREYWGGIFGAHPWLEGPWQTYLGFWEKGGGASGEHSHAINLWQHLAYQIGAGRVVEVQSMMDYVRDDRLDYDQLCLMNLKTENGLVGRCVQDVVTDPPRKWARIQGDNGYVDWRMTPGIDSVETKINGSNKSVKEITKTRPDDFIIELKHINNALINSASSPISLNFGLDTMLVVAATHLSNKSGKTVCINYDRGYSNESLSIIN